MLENLFGRPAIRLALMIILNNDGQNSGRHCLQLFTHHLTPRGARPVMTQRLANFGIFFNSSTKCKNGKFGLPHSNGNIGSPQKPIDGARDFFWLLVLKRRAGNIILPVFFDATALATVEESAWADRHNLRTMAKYNQCTRRVYPGFYLYHNVVEMLVSKIRRIYNKRIFQQTQPFFLWHKKLAR